ncbi:hypothetical protein [Gordonia sp. (in: high G+C Gram-positive bacteria)]
MSVYVTIGFAFADETAGVGEVTRADAASWAMQSRQCWPTEAGRRPS